MQGSTLCTKGLSQQESKVLCRPLLTWKRLLRSAWFEPLLPGIFRAFGMHLLMPDGRGRSAWPQLPLPSQAGPADSRSSFRISLCECIGVLPCSSDRLLPCQLVVACRSSGSQRAKDSHQARGHGQKRRGLGQPRAARRGHRARL